MLTVGDIRKLIKDLPDDTLILQDDPYSEFSYDILDAKIGRTKLNHIDHLQNNENYYESWTEENFKEFLNDNPDESEEINKEYKPCLILYISEYN